MTIAGDFERAIGSIIAQLGSEIILSDASGANTRTERGAITTIGKDDGALINAVGIEGRVLYFLPLSPSPKKFDRVVSPTGRQYTIHDVHEILIDNKMVGLKCIISG